MDKFKKIYAFSTENLDYLNQIDFNDKRVLTIGGSGDHLIETYRLGARKVTCLDINSNAEHYVHLKTVALQHLTYVEFLDFLSRNEQSLNHTVYKRLQPYLKLETTIFLNHLFKQYNNVRESEVFNLSFDSNILKQSNIPYIKDNTTYIKAQQQIKTYDWITSNINKIPAKLKQTWDVILFSNIADYSHKMFKTDNHVQIFFTNCIQPWLKQVSTGGVFMYAYIYDSINKYDSDKRNHFNLRSVREPIYNNIEHFKNREILISSVIAPDTSDTALILENTQ